MHCSRMLALQKFSCGQAERHGRQVGGTQAVWPGSRFFGVFFSRCGVIFAGSGAPGTPRGPSCSRWMSSSVFLGFGSVLSFAKSAPFADALELLIDLPVFVLNFRVFRRASGCRTCRHP